MLVDWIVSRFQPDLQTVVLVFFAYSFLGYIVECVVLTIDKRRLVLDRGFAVHVPFCVIYGFGCLIGYTFLLPLSSNLPLIFFTGAVSATVFEFLVAKIMVRLFGGFWWDYSEKPLNYEGMICLESTMGWGLAGILVVRVVHRPLVAFISMMPQNAASILAVVLVLGYSADFILSARSNILSGRRQRQNAMQADKFQFETGDGKWSGF